MSKVTIDGKLIRAVSAEGQTASLPIAELAGKIAPARMNTCGVILPDGVKAVLGEGHVVLWVHETPPSVMNLKWIAKDSPVKFGPQTRSRQVRISLPYLIVLAVFAPAEHGQLQLSNMNECFFRNKPITDESDDLFFPALLNCSRFVPEEGRSLSWICTQYLDRSSFINERDMNKRLRLSFKALMTCLLQTGFNYSSEFHEHSSWFTESAKVDKRISTIENWEEATTSSPFFAVDVPWLQTGRSIRQVAERIFKNLNARNGTITTDSDLARLIFNSGTKT
jgi:hypothetical protein